MSYKIIATDLDGTLNNDDGEISRGNLEAIQKAKEAGIKIVICSGRSFSSITNFGAASGLNEKGCYGIAFNGSVVYEADTMDIIYENRLKRESALYIIRELKKIDPDAPIIVYAEGNLILCDRDYPEIRAYATRSKVDYQVVDSFEAGIHKDIMKLLIHSNDTGLLERLYSGLSDKMAGYGAMFFSSPVMLEFSSENSNKAVGLQILAKHLGVGMEETVAVGDNFNDIEMVEQAGLGIAVANAVNPLKEAAGYVTKADNNQDAIKEVIELVLGGY